MAETLLLSTLGAYAHQLQLHLDSLRERHQELESAWQRLREIYEGEGAEVFSEAFQSASTRLADYAGHGTQIAQQLQTKIGDLRRFEGAGSDL